MELSDEEKSKIDYRIKKEREEKEKNQKEWADSIFKGCALFGLLMLILKLIHETLNR